jgi:hypothetical protein
VKPVQGIAQLVGVVGVVVLAGFFGLKIALWLSAFSLGTIFGTVAAGVVAPLAILFWVGVFLLVLFLVFLFSEMP